MPVLRMETDLVREIANQISQIAGAVHEEANAMTTAVDALAASWDGPAADLFISEALSVLNQLRGLAHDGDSLKARLNDEIAEWKERDQDGALLFKGRGTVLMPAPHPRPDPELPPPDTGPGNGSPPEDEPDEEPVEEQEEEPANGHDDDNHHDDQHEEDHHDDDQEDQPESPSPPGQSSPGGPSQPADDGDTTGSDTTTEGVTVGAAVGAAAAAATGEKSTKGKKGKHGKHTPNKTGTSEMAPEIVEPPPVFADNQEGNWSSQIEKLNDVTAEIKTLDAKPYSKLSVEELTRLNELHQERNKIQLILEEGIPEDGPGPMHDAFPEGECTWYASSRRDFGWDINGHAKVWGEKALATGYEVGNTPVKGAVMIWQPGVHNANMQFGHVSFVERVVDLGDGSFKVFFTDNHFRDPAAPSSVRIFPGEEGVSFIYGK